VGCAGVVAAVVVGATVMVVAGSVVSGAVVVAATLVSTASVATGCDSLVLSGDPHETATIPIVARTATLRAMLMCEV
jgi:hypothetical protein